MTSIDIPSGTGGQIALRSESLRQHATTLRAWSRAARARSQASRRVARGRRPPLSDLGAPPALPPLPAAQEVDVEDEVPCLGPVPITDLFVMLVDDHGLSVGDAVRGLAVETAAAGYPLDVDAISAADAFDVILAILHRPV
ncbi:hypothetical protein [Nocardioides sp. URHA0032]|uniref:hypothetical protein n=1 Tax=Nocardioides sp. URHA0032 TaxID=1380388 RepID=UPI00048AC0A9|nr:hypothetical protein [Nocardioides sp. URHA0032]